MALRRAGQPLIRLGRIDQRLGETDLVLAREPHDLGVFDYTPCVLAGGGNEIAGQGQAAQAGGALHLVIDLDRDTRFQSGGLGFNLGLGHGGLLQSIIYGKMPYHSRWGCRLDRLLSQHWSASALPIILTCMGSRSRAGAAGQGRSRAAVARSASLEGLAPVRPHQDMLARPLAHPHNPKPICRASAELPFNAAVVAPDTADVVVEALLQ